MSVAFDPEFWWDPQTQSIKFYAHYRGRKIHCAVSRPALEDVSQMFGLVPEDMEYAFRAHRREIQERAAEKIQGGRYESDEKIFVKVADLDRPRVVRQE